MDDMLVDLLPVENRVDPDDDCFGDNVSLHVLLVVLSIEDVQQ